MTNITIDQATGIHEVIIALNNETSGWLIGLLLLMIWIVMLNVVMFMGRRFEDAMIYSSLIATILASLLWAADLLSMTFVLLPLVLLVIGIGIKKFG